ncbi:MAG: glutamate--cysteine ligase [Mangrovibacterium sp.]
MMKEEYIQNKEQLVNYFHEGNTPFENWGIGTEHEKFLYNSTDYSRLAYDGQPGIKQILETIQEEEWEAIREGNNLIGLTKDGASITLEPGGQFELSGKNFSTIHQTYVETRKHFATLSRISKEQGFFTLPMGLDPLWMVEDIHWMPKERYRIMREYMPKVGTLGLHMMTRTATIQVNLDYADEADMIQKMRIAQALQPIASAIFANSPFAQGKPNGYLTYRTEIWNDTDDDRCGFLNFVFDADFGFERWVDYLLDVPMYFIYRKGKYLSSDGITFRDFLNGKHAEKPTIADWELHCSTVFPDVRLKQYIEMRGADGSCVGHIAALSAFWVGLLYDEQSRNEAYEIISAWSIEDMLELRKQVPKKALKATSVNLNAWDIAKKMLQLADDGLTRRANLCCTADESRYLKPLRKIVNSGITQAEQNLHLYADKYQGDFKAFINSFRDHPEDCGK